MGAVLAQVVLVSSSLALRPSVCSVGGVDGVGDVLTGADMLLLLLLLLYKSYPEEKVLNVYLCNKNENIFQRDLNSDLKE